MLRTPSRTKLNTTAQVAAATHHAAATRHPDGESIPTKANRKTVPAKMVAATTAATMLKALTLMMVQPRAPKCNRTRSEVAGSQYANAPSTGFRAWIGLARRQRPVIMAPRHRLPDHWTEA